MQILKIQVEVYPQLADKVRTWLRRREQLRLMAEHRELSPLEYQEYLLIDSRLASFASDLMELSDPQQRTLH